MKTTTRKMHGLAATLLCLPLAVVVMAQGTRKEVLPAGPNKVISGALPETGTAAPGSGTATPAGAGMVTIRNSPQGRAIYDDVKGIARMTKDVRVTQTGEDFILYADELTYNRPLNRANATKNLRVETRNSTLRGDRIVADFNSRTITLLGNVTISSHGEKDGITPTRTGIRAELRHKPSLLKCDRADWDYEINQGVATGNIRMTQGDNTGTCRKLTYDEVKNIAFLDGDVRFSDGKKRTLLCNDLTVFIDVDKVESRQPCTINFPRDKSTEPAPGPTKAPPAQFGAPPEISDEDLKAFEVPALPGSPTSKSSPVTPAVNKPTAEAAQKAVAPTPPPASKP